MVSFKVAVSGTPRGGVSFDFFLDFVTPGLLDIFGAVRPLSYATRSLGCYQLYIPV